MINKKIKINGMSCSHCTSSVEKVLRKIEEIISVNVSLKDKEAVIELSKDIDNGIIKNEIEERGYSVISIENI